MERTVVGKIYFEVEVVVDCMHDELEDEILERTTSMFEEMDANILLRKLLNDSTVNVSVEDVEFDEVY